jgi:hypothetical protein
MTTRRYCVTAESRRQVSRKGCQVTRGKGEARGQAGFGNAAKRTAGTAKYTNSAALLYLLLIAVLKRGGR